MAKRFTAFFEAISCPPSPAPRRAKIFQSVKEHALRGYIESRCIAARDGYSKRIVEDAVGQPPDSVLKPVTGTDNLKLKYLIRFVG